jgi:pyruvate-formate lyase-activating enzyme
VHLLPYHPTGEAKFARLGRGYDLAGTPAPTAERMRMLEGIYAEHGLEVRNFGRLSGQPTGRDASRPSKGSSHD